MKLIDIEQYINTPYEVEITLKKVPEHLIIEASRLYAVRIDTSIFYDEVTIRRNKVVLTLQSEMKQL